MIIPDINLLLYAHFDGFEQHAKARAWWIETVTSNEVVGLPPVVVFGFLRLATSARIFDAPMSVEEAALTVESWLEQPGVSVLRTDQTHLERVITLLSEIGFAGNMTTDAQIAAHAILRRAVVATNDTDFARFLGVVTVNPVATNL